MERLVFNFADLQCGNAMVTGIIVPETNNQVTTPSILPSRFNSTSQLAERSIVQPELNSISDPKSRSDEPVQR